VVSSESKRRDSPFLLSPLPRGVRRPGTGQGDRRSTVDPNAWRSGADEPM